MSLNHQKQYNRELRDWLLKVFEYTAYISTQDLVKRVCPICGSENSRFFANNDYLDYEQCQFCSLVYMNPTMKAGTVNEGFKGDDELLMEYFSIIKKYKTELPEKPDPWVDNKLLDIYRLKPQGKLLDVGCSVGDFLHKAQYFYQVEGVEVNPKTSAIAAQYFQVHRNYLSELGLPAVYDIVTLHQILYGVPDPVGLFKDIHKILKADGILYVNTPNADSYAVQLYKGKVNHLYGYTTQNLLNRKSLEVLAHLTGFKLKTFRTEWIDIYMSDLMEYLDRPDQFIHKRNCNVRNYEENVSAQDNLQCNNRLDQRLGNRGNYLVAVLEKVEKWHEKDSVF